jgi:hypothetical protein
VTGVDKIRSKMRETVPAIICFNSDRLLLFQCDGERERDVFDLFQCDRCIFLWFNLTDWTCYERERKRNLPVTDRRRGGCRGCDTERSRVLANGAARCRDECLSEVANYADILTQLIVGGKRGVSITNLHGPTMYSEQWGWHNVTSY